MAQSTRRQFLAAASATALASTATGLNAAMSPTQDDIPIVDTHQHLWDLSKIQPPWLNGAPKVLSQTYGLAEYKTATEGLNVVQAVYMEVDVDPKDHPKEADSLIAICREGKSPQWRR